MSKHKSIPKKIRMQVWEKYNHHCAYCGYKLEYKDMQVDHIDSAYVHCDYKKENTLDEINDIDNLMPSCKQCNLYKSTFDLETFRDRLTSVMLKNLQKTFQYRLALKYGLIEENIKPIEFYFVKQEDRRNG